MTAADSNKIEEEFIEAKNNWELEKLYIDLASAKGKALTPVEKKFLRGLLCGFSPAEIASTVYQSRSSSTVRVYLSNGLYKYIEEMLSNVAQTSVKVKSWSRVTHLLEKAGYKKAWLQIQQPNNQINTHNKKPDVVMKSTQNWGEAIDVSIFHGRTTELTQSKQWIVEEDCRLVVLLGMGGIGKTAFSVKLAEQIQDKFEFVIWRSLRLAPPLEVILNQLIAIFSPAENQKSENVDNLITQLIQCMRDSRCLIVLDNLDSILCSDYAHGTENYSDILDNPSRKNTSAWVVPQLSYRPGYQGYGELIRRVGDSQHQSCLVLTSREKPPEIAASEGETLPVRCLKLTGLSYAESNLILKTKGFGNSRDEECKLLIDAYAGNPLFIKLVATAIQELFAGSIYEFLAQGTVVFGEIRIILDQQFNRLSSLEKLIMYWTCLNKDLISVRKLQKDIVPRVSQRLILEAIELLQRRCLLDKATATLVERHPSSSSDSVLMEYVAERLIEENFKLSEEKAGYLLMFNTIFEAQLKNYIREIRLRAEF